MAKPDLPDGIEWGDRTAAWWESLDSIPGARPAKPTTEAVIEKVTETPLQRITERRIERRSLESKPAADIPAPPARRGGRKH